MTPEAKVKAKVKKTLLEIGAYYAMPIGSGYGNAGVPDFLVCYKGIFVGIECKANGNKPTALQLKNLADIESAGGLAFIIDENNVANLRNLLENIHD
jgi:pantoate kinase